MTSDSDVVLALLRARHAPPDWHFAEEVHIEDTTARQRRVDAVAVRVNPFRVEFHGFEVKISRADWLNEVNDPTKSDARLLLDSWWVVQGQEGLVRREELPYGAGLISVKGRELATVVPATPRRKQGTGVDRQLVGAFLRRLDPLEPRNWWESRVRDAERRGQAKGRNEAARFQGRRERSGREPPGPLNLP